MLIQSRTDARAAFRDIWAKARARQLLEPMEQIVAAVIALHPEYHPLLESDAELADEYTPERGETNPFLHMGLHIAIREQIGAGRPAGVGGIRERLLARYGDEHAVEHKMVECLAVTLWEAQNAGTLPDDQAYLERLKRL
ncbi:MAG: DUF1841 family protein [Gammaproteobacteria bacterium]|nr:DUF1841 family protein [Gammaproteobacteria bacterium]